MRAQERGRRHPSSCVRRGLANGGDKKRAGLEGCVIRIGQIENIELGARFLAEPALQERA